MQVSLYLQTVASGEAEILGLKGFDLFVEDVVEDKRELGPVFRDEFGLSSLDFLQEEPAREHFLLLYND